MVSKKCVHCGSLFLTKRETTECCSAICKRKEDKLALEEYAERAETVKKEPKQHDQSYWSQVAKLQKIHNMSYGQLVAKGLI